MTRNCPHCGGSPMHTRCPVLMAEHAQRLRYAEAEHQARLQQIEKLTDEWEVVEDDRTLGDIGVTGSRAGERLLLLRKREP
jgi:hypothetical protein